MIIAISMTLRILRLKAGNISVSYLRDTVRHNTAIQHGYMYWIYAERKCGYNCTL